MEQEYWEFCQQMEGICPDLAANYSFFWEPWKKIHRSFLNALSTEDLFLQKNAFEQEERAFLKVRMRLFSTIQQKMKSVESGPLPLSDILKNHDGKFSDIITNYKNEMRQRVVMQNKMHHASHEYFSHYLGG